MVEFFEAYKGGLVDSLDKNNPTPLYYQLYQLLKERVETGVWKPGDVIPTEHEIVAQYGISRPTVRQAVLALVNDGYLRREKSKGTIVTSRANRIHFVGSLMSFSEEMASRGIPHVTHVLEQKVISADDDIAKKLNLRQNDQVYYLKRIRYVSDNPFLFDEHFIPYSLCPGIEKKYVDNTSLYHLLQSEYGFNLHHGQIQFEPINPPSKEIIDLLQIYPNTNLIFAERIVYSDKEMPLDYFKSIIHGKFSIDVVKTPEKLK
jgi:GntR family transcriptional regulator